ncbi:MAG: hypothetical protein QG608_3079 [Actinomycetota bacterium]|nr:hypothetical protein [Actinomycetota bacterium]
MTQSMSLSERLSRVRELRGRGLSRKQIARELGLTTAEVAPLLRQTAGSLRAVATERELLEPADRELVGCWINPGWSTGLGLDEVPEWAEADPERWDDAPSGGLAGVMVARADRSGRVTVCGYLVDVYCLGVKNTTGPRTTNSRAVTKHTTRFFSAFDCAPRSVPLEVAQHLVHGAVAYARSFGFEPHPEFVDTEPYLGVPSGPCPIRFGRDGRPFYISGPFDDPRAVATALEAAAGQGNYSSAATP